MTDTVLNRALTKFRQSLTDGQWQLFTASSVEKVNDEILSIQVRHGSQKQLRSLGRISKFLEAMTQIEQLVQIFLNVSEVVAFVWGPIKLALVMAGTRVQTLELLLDTYVEIGEVIPSLRQYEVLFDKAPAVLEVLEKYFCDILEFHLNAMEVFGRPGWRNCFDSFWKSFRTKFNPILESLKRHRALLRDERLNAAVLGIREGRDQTLEAIKKSADRSSANFDGLNETIKDVYTKLSSQVYGLAQSSETIGMTLQREIALQEIHSMLIKLEPSDYTADQQAALQSCHDDSGTWIFQVPGFLNWLQSRNLPDCILFIHGMPGAGKTSLASRVVDQLPSLSGLKHISILYFYFKHIDNVKRSMSHMLRALLAQLVRQDASLVHVLYEKCCLVSSTEAQAVATLKVWAAELLKTQTRCTIVLDGLDECNHHDDGQEAKRVLEWLTECVIPDCSKAGSEIHLLCLGQRDGVVDTVLSDYPSISLDTSPLHLEDIRSFTAARATEIAERFPLDPGMKEDIIQRVTSASKAMFLYAKLVMDNLMAQGSTRELYEELNEKFPEGIFEAYERIALRILDSPKRSRGQRKAASQIIQWLTCAVRPLRWREIQSFFCIDPYKGTCDLRNRRVDGCKPICGSFVEINQIESNMVYLDDADPLVSLVHDTARCYLIQSNRVVLPEITASMAIFSSAYLASLPFEAESAVTIREYALSGYFGLLDYSVSSWQEHLQLTIEHRQHLSESSLHCFQQAFLTILKHLEFHEIPEDLEDDMGSLTSFVNTNSLKHGMQRLEILSTAIRKVMEEIDLTALDNQARKTFLLLNGEQRYKCPKPRCPRFFLGFESREPRDRHASQHYTQFICSAEGCPRAKVGFFDRSDLDQHTKETHIKEKPTDLFRAASEPKDPLRDACARGDIQAVKHLTAQRKGEPLIIESHILLAAENGQVELCQYFARNVDICRDNYDQRGPTYTSILSIIKMSNINMFRLLHNAATTEQKSYYINSTDFGWHIGNAVCYATQDFLDMLLSMNSTRTQPLSYADIFLEATNIMFVQYKDNTKLFEYIFSLSSPEDISTILSRKTLDKALNNENAPALVFLLQRVDDDISHMKSDNCDSPLYTAMKRHKHYCVLALLANDLVNSMAVFDREKGERPIHMACRVTSLSYFGFLLPYCIDHLNDENAKGQTPLHLAVLRGGPSRVDALLKTGVVDISKRDGRGKTALEIAKKPKIVALLQQAAESAGLPSSLKTGQRSEGLGGQKFVESPESISQNDASVSDATNLEEPLSHSPAGSENFEWYESVALPHSQEAIENIGQGDEALVLGGNLTLDGSGRIQGLDWDEWLSNV